MVSARLIHREICRSIFAASEWSEKYKLKRYTFSICTIQPKTFGPHMKMTMFGRSAPLLPLQLSQCHICHKATFLRSCLSPLEHSRCCFGICLAGYYCYCFIICLHHCYLAYNSVCSWPSFWRCFSVAVIPAFNSDLLKHVNAILHLSHLPLLSQDKGNTQPLCYFLLAQKLASMLQQGRSQHKDLCKILHVHCF